MTVNTVVPIEIPEKLNKYHFTYKVKRALHESNEVIQHWLTEGWIVREIRYNPDGISVGEEYYRIGPSYIISLQHKQMQLEESGIDVSLYGLVSMGKIVPIYFTGNVRNEFSKYSFGAVHATTDNAVLLSPFSTTNKTLWLVENRAILTRMAVELDFLKQTNSCIICLDGQIRSAHRFLIELLQLNIKQTIIWTDTDAASTTRRSTSRIAKGHSEFTATA